MKHDAIRVDGACMDAQALAAQHIAALETVPLLTDFPGLADEAARLARRARWYAGNDNRGMLGRGGIAPHVEALVHSAQHHGFDWRERFAAPVDPRALTEVVYNTAGGR